MLTSLFELGPAFPAFPRLGSQSCSQATDPFCDSQPPCSCETFCAGSCAINATGRANKTLYRMTMNGVGGITSKNTGDQAGDTSFGELCVCAVCCSLEQAPRASDNFKTGGHGARVGEQSEFANRRLLRSTKTQETSTFGFSFSKSIRSLR